jgi:hypothetical protein
MPRHHISPARNAAYRSGIRPSFARITRAECAENTSHQSECRIREAPRAYVTSPNAAYRSARMTFVVRQRRARGARREHILPARNAPRHLQKCKSFSTRDAV